MSLNLNQVEATYPREQEIAGSDYVWPGTKLAGTLRVKAAFMIRETYEVAAWFRDHAVYPGEYPVYAKPNEQGQLTHYVSLHTVITDACLQSLFGGIGYGADNAGEREIGKQQMLTRVCGSTRYKAEGYVPFSWMHEAEFIPALTQDRFDTLNNELAEAMQQYVSGLITLVEFCDFASLIKSKLGSDPAAFAGLLDPNTGLRFPTKEETNAFMATVVEITEG